MTDNGIAWMATSSTAPSLFRQALIRDGLFVKLPVLHVTLQPLLTSQLLHML